MYQVNLAAGIGPFELNTHFYPHLESFGIITYTPGIGDHGIYTIDAEATSLYTKGGIIKGIACAANCSLYGLELMGLNISTILTLLRGELYDVEHVDYADKTRHIVYCFENAGLQLWTNEAGKVVKIFIAANN
jgi:hypothetical protein